MSEFRRRVATSRLAPAAALPGRIRSVARYNASVARESGRWLIRSRERTNHTYELSALNRGHLAWFVAAVADIEVARARELIDELHEDTALRQHVASTTEASAYRGLADTDVKYARRAGWYALIRALQPTHVVETGTDKGLGSCVIAAALLRNGSGRLTTLDVNGDAGYLVSGRYADVVERRVGDSVAQLREGTSAVDLFLHDSLHTYAHETAEIEAVSARLTHDALVLSDNAELTDALADWSDRNDRRFLFFAEVPEDHWYPGSGIGASWRK